MYADLCTFLTVPGQLSDNKENLTFNSPTHQLAAIVQMRHILHACAW